MLFRMVTICDFQFKRNDLKSGKIFLNFLFHFWNVHQILNISKKWMIVIANVFPKLKNVKSFFRPLSKKRRFRTRFDTQHLKVFQILARSPWEGFDHVFSSFSWKLIWGNSPIVLGKILRMFLNAWIAADKDPVQECENLRFPIEMELSEKPKDFSEFIVPFPESSSNFKCFEKKDDCHSSCISEIRDCENLAQTTL